MQVRTFLTGSALAAAAVLTAAVPAVAAPPAPTMEADVLGVVRIDRDDPTVGYVKARYRCEGGEQVGLWVSVKQTADRTADPALAQEGSSRISAAWSDSHRNPITCDGRWHVDEFTVDQLEPNWDPEVPRPGPGALARGEAYVQFCITDPALGEHGLLVSQNEFVHVR
ncbi:hypothetical protein ACI8AC_06980 [Geodermatophilus sp. SYSU D00758]